LTAGRSTDENTLLVIGGSGAMGRNVIRHVLQNRKNPWKVRVFTRNPQSAECLALHRQGEGRVTFVTGNSDRAADLRSALVGVQAVFCNTNYWSCFQELLSHERRRGETDPWRISRFAEQTEVSQGKTILELSREAKVSHFIYSSLDAMGKPSHGMFAAPHFDAKAEVEEYIHCQREHLAWYNDCTTVLVTVPYMENFQSSRMFRAGGSKAAIYLDENRDRKCLLVRVPLGSAAWPMVALDDIGWFASHVLENREHWVGRTLRIASESLPMEAVVDIFLRTTGIEAAYDPYTLAEYRELKVPGIGELANMFGFIEKYGIARDFAMLRELKPDLATFEGWLRQSQWVGQHDPVQKGDVSMIDEHTCK
jgi:uncharacterized protein YbjT (DUF2867 family)